MTAAPEVSVVIATRDRAGFLRQAVDCVLRQRTVALELIVVDDGSRDATPDLLAALSDERVHVVRHAHGVGTSASRNEGIQLARGPWVAFLDDDDLWAPDRLRVQLDAMGDAVFGYGAQVVVDPRRTVVGALPAPRPEDLSRRLRIRSLIGGPSAVIARTAALRQLGGFAPQYGVLNDWDLWRKLSDTGPAAAVADLLVGYTVHDGNMHLADPRALLRDFERFARHHDVPAEAGIELLSWVADDNRRAGNWRNAAWAHTQSARRYRRPIELARALSVAVRRPTPDPSQAPRLLGPEWLAPYRLSAPARRSP